MMLDNRGDKLNPKKNNLYGAISIGIALTLSILVLNFFLQIVKTPKLQGMPILISPLLSLAGFIFGFVGFRRNRKLLSLIGMVLSIILFVFPFAFWTIGYIVEMLTKGN